MDLTEQFKKDQAEERVPDLTDLDPLIKLFKEQKAKVDALKDELEAAEAAFKHTARDEIPAIMNYLGYTELKLATKEKVTVKEDASVSVPEDKEPQFFKFLEERGEQDIIKLQFAFPRMSIEKRQLLFDLLDANDFAFDFKEGVHPQTLKSYFKKLLGVGAEDRAQGIKEGRYLHPSVVEPFTSMFIYYTTSITAPRGNNL